MAKQMQFGPLSVTVEDPQAQVLQNGSEWYAEQREHHQAPMGEITAFLLGRLAYYSGTPSPSLSGGNASEPWRRGTILGWLLTALLSKETPEPGRALSSLA